MEIWSVRQCLSARQKYVLFIRRLGSADEIAQDDNVTLRRWHPNGPNAQVEQKTDILAHHEVLLRLDAVDLDRGLAYLFLAIH